MSERYRLKVKGMTCDSCEEHVEEALRSAALEEVQASWRKGEATFRAGGPPEREALDRTLRQVGYRALELEALPQEAEPPTVLRRNGGGDFDLLVVGSGSAAFAAAIRATDLGARVALVEEDTVGGTCVNIGCVPSKAVLRSSEAYHEAGHHPFAGVPTSAGPLDLKAVVDQKDELVRQLRKEKYLDLADAYGFPILQGRGVFQDPETLAVNGRIYRARSYLIATGSSPAIPPIEGLGEVDYLTSTTALELTELPETVAVVGANYIGLEMGQYFANLGSKVALFDLLPRIAPFEEPEISQTLHEVLTDQGLDVFAPAQIWRVEPNGRGATLHFTFEGEERTLTVDRLLVATGRRPNTRNMGLGEAGVELDRRGAVVVDPTLRTTSPAIWAAGDVTGAPQFVYVAAYQGALAAQNALSESPRSQDLSAVPRVTFVRPQIAAVGLTEEEARRAGHEVKTSVLDLKAVPRALVNRETRGLIKLVADAESDRLLGMHALSESAGEIVLAGIYAVKFGLTVQEIRDTFHPYLTMAEGVKLAAQSFEKDVALLSCCAA